MPTYMPVSFEASEITCARLDTITIVHMHASTHALALTHVGPSVSVCTSRQEYTHSCMRIRVIRAGTR